MRKKEKNSNEDHVYRYPKNRNQKLNELKDIFCLLGSSNAVVGCLQPNFPLDAIIKFRITQIWFYFFRRFFGIFSRQSQQRATVGIDQHG